MNEEQPLQIIPFSEEEHLSLVPELTELLHEAYKPLADRGFRYSATHQSPEITLKRLKYFESFLAFWNGQLAGTIALIKWKADSPCEYYRREGLYHFGQYAVKPEFQGRGIARSLLFHIEKRTRDLGGKELTLDTAEGAIELIDMYKRHGYKAVSTTRWESTNYRSIIMAKEISY
jgi:GNAT superfamily N-acetyltransferase